MAEDQSVGSLIKGATRMPPRANRIEIGYGIRWKQNHARHISQVVRRATFSKNINMLPALCPGSMSDFCSIRIG